MSLTCSESHLFFDCMQKMNIFHKKITKSKEYYYFSEQLYNDHFINGVMVPIQHQIESIQDSVIKCYNVENLKNILVKLYKIKLESSVGKLSSKFLNFVMFLFALPIQQHHVFLLDWMYISALTWVVYVIRIWQMI